MADYTIKAGTPAEYKTVLVKAAVPAMVMLDVSPLEAAFIYKALGQTHGQKCWKLYKEVEKALDALGIPTDDIRHVNDEERGRLSQSVFDVLIPEIVKKAGH